MNDDFTPVGVSMHIVYMIIGIIVVGIVIAFCVNSAYVSDIEDNGEGMGLPLASADGSTDTSITFTSGTGGIQISGAYTGRVNDMNIVLLLSDKKAVYVRDGTLHYFDGINDSTPSSVTIIIHNHNIGAEHFDWCYFPHAEGAYRTYDKSVKYNIDERVAGMASTQGYVAISMNDTVTNDNIDVPVHATVYDSQYGVNKVKYTWSD